jgi:hypothetical protein
MKTTSDTFSSIKDIVPSLETATMWDWSRSSAPLKTGEIGTLSIYHDDIQADLRLIRTVRIFKSGLRVEARRLSGYNAKKNMWAQYCDAHQAYAVAGSRGLKTLKEYIEKMAAKKTGFPNPSSFSVYLTA